MMNTSIYIHIPFCHVKCSYCAFNVYTNLAYLFEEYVDAVCRELKQIALKQPETTIRSIYLGGGTPSLLSHIQLKRILDTVKQSFRVSQQSEIAMECNPEDLQQIDYCRGLADLGINRLSIGAQSSNESELKLFGRSHNQESISIAVSHSKRAGIENINLDLIFGSPNSTMENWQSSVHYALNQDVKHLSLYGLELEDGTTMTNWIEDHRLPQPDDDLMVEMYNWATDELNHYGFEQYEISNWSKEGFESEHNLQYWWNAPYLGIGAGAHGYANGYRYAVVRSPRKYIQQVSAHDLEILPYPMSNAVDEYYKVSFDDEISETIMMGMRLVKQGIQLDEFQKRFNVSLLEIRKETIHELSNLGLIEITQNALRITTKGRFISNRILRDLI